MVRTLVLFGQAKEGERGRMFSCTRARAGVVQKQDRRDAGRTRRRDARATAAGCATWKYVEISGKFPLKESGQADRPSERVDPGFPPPDRGF